MLTRLHLLDPCNSNKFDVICNAAQIFTAFTAVLGYDNQMYANSYL